MIVAALILAALLQDPIADEARFRSTLERIERVGLAVPDLPDGLAELDKLAGGSRIPLPVDLRDRHTVVRAQAAILQSFHAVLLKHKGALLDVPLPTGKPVSVTIVDVLKRGVKVSRPEGIQDFAYSDLDPEWVLTVTRSTWSAESDAALTAGLWLAKAAKWDAAFLALGDVKTNHPLAAEARKRGIEAAVLNFDAIVKGKRWAEALAKLEALDRLAPADARLGKARGKLLDAMVEHGKDLCRKNSKSAMKDLIDLIAKHFPDGASRIEDIREANRWIKVTDPKKFSIEAPKGPPWLIDPGEKEGVGKFFVEDNNEYSGISITLRFEKGSKAHGGVSWKNGTRVAWINADKKFLGVGQGKARESISSDIDYDVQIEGKHVIVVRIREGQYVVHYNGVEAHRMKSDDTRFVEFGLHVSLGRIWFDEVLLLKKE